MDFNCASVHHCQRLLVKVWSVLYDTKFHTPWLFLYNRKPAAQAPCIKKQLYKFAHYKTEEADDIARECALLAVCFKNQVSHSISVWPLFETGVSAYSPHDSLPWTWCVLVGSRRGSVKALEKIPWELLEIYRHKVESEQAEYSKIKTRCWNANQNYTT